MPSAFVGAVALWLWFTVLFANFAEALAEGRSKAQAASLRGMRKDTWAKKLAEPRHGAAFTPAQGAGPAQGRRRAGRSRRRHPARRRSHRRRGLGRRERHHRRIGAGGARVRRRLLGRDRRHPRAVGLAGGAHRREPGRVLPGPHDRHGGKRQAPEDAQRDRADHPAGGADHRVPDRHGDAAALLDLRGRGGRCRHRGVAHRAGGAAGVPDPDHHRRPAVGRRRGRHEPHDAGQRDRHLGPRGRSRRRHRRAAARQDRHHHPRQPPGQRLVPGARRVDGPPGARRAAGLAGRRNARRPQHRRAGPPGRHATCARSPMRTSCPSPRRPA